MESFSSKLMFWINSIIVCLEALYGPCVFVSGIEAQNAVTVTHESKPAHLQGTWNEQSTKWQIDQTVTQPAHQQGTWNEQSTKGQIDQTITQPAHQQATWNEQSTKWQIDQTVTQPAHQMNEQSAKGQIDQTATQPAHQMATWNEQSTKWQSDQTGTQPAHQMATWNEQSTKWQIDQTVTQPAHQMATWNEHSTKGQIDQTGTQPAHQQATWNEQSTKGQIDQTGTQPAHLQGTWNEQSTKGQIDQTGTQPPHQQGTWNEQSTKGQIDQRGTHAAQRQRKKAEQTKTVSRIFSCPVSLSTVFSFDAQCDDCEPQGIETAQDVMIISANQETHGAANFVDQSDPDNVTDHFYRAASLSLNASLTFWEISVCGQDSICQLSNETKPFLRHSSPFRCTGCSCVDCLDQSLTTQITDRPAPYSSCLTGLGEKFLSRRDNWYLFVNMCPKSWVDPESRSLCENSSNSLEDKLMYPPIYSRKNDLNYINSYCAECHHDSGPLTAWKIKMVCSDDLNIGYFTSLSRIEEGIEAGTCHLIVEPPDGVSYQKCRPKKDGVDVISHCNQTTDLDHYNEDIVTACGMYSNPLTVSSVTYRNVFCALCNGKQDDIIDTFMLARPGYEINDKDRYEDSFSLIFNLHPKKKSVNSRCSKQQFFRRIKKVCRKVFCSPGHVVVDHGCRDILQTAKNVGFRFHYQLVPSEMPHVTNATLDDTWVFNHLCHILGVFEDNLNSTDANMTMLLCQTKPDADGYFNITDLFVDFSLVVDSEVSQDFAERSLLPIYNSRWEFDSNNWTARFFGYKNNVIKSSRENCHVFRAGDVQRSADIKIHLNGFLTMDPLSRCNQTELLPCEYSLDKTTGNLKSNITGQQYKLGEYIITEGNSARICINQSEEYEHLQGRLTSISMAVSICFLFLTLPLCLLSNARHTIPGKIIIAFILTLIFAQFLFFLRGKVRENKLLCVLLGMATHYFWLCVFGVKHIAGYHMYVSFVYPLRNKSRPSTTFGRYMAYAYGFPFFIAFCYVSVNLVLSSSLSVGYGDNGDCYLSTNIGLGLVFVAPVCLVLLSNGFFFIRAIYAIRKMSTFEKYSNQSNRSHNRLFLKMSLILGVTWVVGFLGNAFNSNELWYAFDFLNGGTGIFLFLIHIWNHDIAKELRGTLCDISQPKSQSSLESELSGSSKNT